MDKATYLRNKEKATAEQAVFKRENLCFKCHWPQKPCLCQQIQPFETETFFVLLMHPMEAKKERLGTGRISHATVKNSQIFVDVDFTEHRGVNAIIHDPKNLCMVLYPGQNAINLSSDDISPLLEAKQSGRRLVLFLIDATWQCANKIITYSQNIKTLPRLSFTVSQESIFEIKEQPEKHFLSTLESIHVFLTEAHRRGLECLPASPQNNLISVFQYIINFSLECALDPSRSKYRGVITGYTKREDRTRNKKKQLHSI